MILLTGVRKDKKYILEKEPCAIFIKRRPPMPWIQRFLLLFSTLLLTTCISPPVDTFLQPEGWSLVWQEEFDNDGLPDPAVWTFETEGNAWAWGNGEDQYYTDSRLENARVENGVLNIIALKENFEGRKYTSARINSRKAANFLYGRMVVRARIPEGQGIWPAIWMMPTESIYGSWPDSGEIDIMEYFGWLPDDSIHSNIHTHAYNHKQGNGKGGQIIQEGIHEEFHDYILEWYPDRLDFYLDEKKIFSYARPSDDWQEWPFNRPFYFILNNAVGGDWCRENGGVDDSIFPQTFQVDYVRVYEGRYPGEHRLNLNQTSGGTIQQNSDKPIFRAGESTLLTAIPEPGYRFAGWSGDAAGTKNPLEIHMGREKNISAFFELENELLKNRSFQHHLSGWGWWMDKPHALGEVEIEEGHFKMTVTKAGEQAWQVQMNQGIPLLGGRSYQLRFRARSNEGNPIKVNLTRAYAPYDSFWSTEVMLQEEWKDYQYLLTLTEGDPQSRLEFDLGQYAQEILLDDISLVILD